MCDISKAIHSVLVSIPCYRLSILTFAKTVNRNKTYWNNKTIEEKPMIKL